MGEEGVNSEYPCVVWEQTIDSGKEKGQTYRLVQVSEGRIDPEKRKPDDAMGCPAWESTMWGRDWCMALAMEYVELLKRGVAG